MGIERNALEEEIEQLQEKLENTQKDLARADSLIRSVFIAVIGRENRATLERIFGKAMMLSSISSSPDDTVPLGTPSLGGDDSTEPT